MNTSLLPPNLQRSTSRDKPTLSPYKPIGTGYVPIGATAKVPSTPVNVGDPGFQAFHAGLVAQSGGEQSMGGSTLARKMTFQGGPFKGMTQAQAMEHATGLWSGMSAGDRAQYLPKASTPTVGAGAPGLRPMPTMQSAPAPVPSANTSLLTAGLQAQRGLSPLTVNDSASAGPLAPGQGRQITVNGQYGSGSSTFKPVTPAPAPVAAPVASAPAAAPLTGEQGPPVTLAPLPALKADNARQMAALPADQQAKVMASMGAPAPTLKPTPPVAAAAAPKQVAAVKPAAVPAEPMSVDTTAIDKQIADTRPALVRGIQAVGVPIAAGVAALGKAIPRAIQTQAETNYNAVAGVAKGIGAAAKWAFVGDPDKAKKLREKKNRMKLQPQPEMAGVSR